MVDGQTDDDDLYGILRPRPGSALEPRTVSSDTALLFMTLAEPAALPRYVLARLDDDTERTIGRLVLDGVLEVEHAGAFFSAADAGGLLVTGRSRGGRGRIGELSEAALRYGQELTELPPGLLARRLYGYGTRPLSPQLRRKLAGEAAIAAASGLLPGGPADAPLAMGWTESTQTESEHPHWRHWRARRTDDAGGTTDGSMYKLYVSPALDALPEAVAAVAETLGASHGASAFKLGRTLHGLCRPDKLVAYFDRLDDLRAGASLLRERLAGSPAQGVPFTAAVTDDGLLSWGADPPLMLREGRTSWRAWVVERLAEQLAHAVRTRTERADGDLAPWRFALERLRLSGLDTDSWIPASGMWPEALASA